LALETRENCASFFGTNPRNIEEITTENSILFRLPRWSRAGGDAFGIRTGIPEPCDSGTGGYTPGMPSRLAPARRTALRVLHLEDSELDHELAMAHLRRSGVQVESTRVVSPLRALLVSPQIQ
jgi:hypothetical protein